MLGEHGRLCGITVQSGQCCLPKPSLSIVWLEDLSTQEGLVRQLIVFVFEIKETEI
jgi:hypothetical protein